jgi:hypothetical protein
MVPPCRCLPARLCQVVHGGLIVGGVLGGNTARILECALDEVPLSTMPCALLAANGQRSWAAQVGLTTSLWLIT